MGSLAPEVFETPRPRAPASPAKLGDFGPLGSQASLESSVPGMSWAFEAPGPQLQDMLGKFGTFIANATMTTTTAIEASSSFDQEQYPCQIQLE